MASRGSLRASDADRDAVAERLRTATIEGRLDTEELDERLGAALSARTYGELDQLLTDLPSDLAPWRARYARAVPAVQSALAVAIPILVTMAVIAAVVVAIVIAAAWWACWVLAWFFMCGRRGGATRRLKASGMHRGLAARTARPAPRRAGGL